VQPRKPPLFVLDTLCMTDFFPSDQTAVELCRDGVALRLDGTRQTHFIPTDQPPEPGLKVMARASLDAVLTSPLIGRREAAGDGLRMGGALRQLLRAGPAGGCVQLLNSGPSSADLVAFCDRAGLACHCLARQSPPRNLILPLRPDRVIIREEINPGPPCLGAQDWQTLAHLLSGADAVVSASPKDGAQTAAVVSLGNGAGHCFQPTGSLPPPLSAQFLTTAREAVANFDEWKQVCRWAGLPVPDCSEESPEAPPASAALLRALKGRRWAGLEAAVCTLGRHGSVVADWQRDRVCGVALEMLDHPGVPTPVGAGDRFLAAWVFFRTTWSNAGHLRDPLAATGVRATHTVARALGLGRGDYDVRVNPL
jgi:hypothetical protein